VVQVYLEKKETEEFRDHLDCVVLTVHRVFQDLKDHKETKENGVLLDHQESLDIQDPKERKGKKVQRELKELKATLA